MHLDHARGKQFLEVIACARCWLRLVSFPTTEADMPKPKFAMTRTPAVY
jgi:hypothetical protein